MTKAGFHREAPDRHLFYDAFHALSRMLLDPEDVAFWVVSQEEPGVWLRPFWRRIVNFSAQGPRGFTTVVDALNMEIQSECAPDASLRRVSNGSSFGYVTRDLMNDEFEAAAPQARVMLIANGGRQPQRPGVEGRDLPQVFHE